MQKQSFENIPYFYRPYDFSSDFPVYVFLGDYWKIHINIPEYLHFHNALEIGYCLEGSCTLHLESGCTFCGSGDFTITFPQLPHMLTARTETASWEYLYLDAETFFKSKGPCMENLWQIFYMMQHVPAIITKNEFPLLYNCLSQIFQEFHEKKPLYKDAVSGLLSFLAGELNRITIHSGYSSIEEPEGAISYIRQALSYIYEHYRENITIQTLSSFCCISESHFRRIFKTVVGISPLEHLQHYRIQQACHLLYLNQKPIHLIAQEVGYRSLSSFNRQFQQYLHCSPSRWQKEHTSVPYIHEVHSYEESGTRHIFQI